MILNGQGTVAAFAQTFATQVLVLALNVATGVLTARLLGPDGRGVFTAVTLWPQFMAMLALFGLQNAVVFRMRLAPDELNSVATAAMAIGLLVSLAAAFAGALVIPFAMGGQYQPGVIRFAIASTAIITAVNLMTMLLRPVFVVCDRIAVSNVSAWANPLCYLVIMLAVLLLAPMTATVAAICQFASAILVLGWMVWRLRAIIRLDLSGFSRQSRRLLSFMVRSGPGEAMSVLAGNLDRIVLVPLISAADLGFYAVAFSLSRLLTIIQLALTPVALPSMAHRTPAEAKILHDRLFRFTLYAVVGISLGAFGLGGLALRLCYGPAFAPAAPLFKILVVEAGIGCLCFLPAQLTLSLGRPGFLSALQIASFAVMLLALLILVPAFGAMGAALSMLASTTVRLATLLAGMRFSLRLGLPRLLPAADDITRIAEAFRKH
jgi:O-antigen/teichoic acid export membrane protein